MTKFNYTQAQVIKEKSNKPLIEKEIRKLKEDLRRVRYSRIETMYKILSRIILLRKETNSRYGIKSLRNEEGINLTSSQIRLIFSYPFMSSRSMALVNEGAISDTVICFMIWRFKFLREIQWQDRLVKAYLSGRIKSSEVGEINEKDLKHFLLTGNKIRTGDRYAMSILKTFSSIQTRIKQVTISKENKEKLSSRLKKLEKIIQTK